MQRQKCDLRLMFSVHDVSHIPTVGKSLIIVAVVDDVLHFRIFEDDGKTFVNTDEKLPVALASPASRRSQEAARACGFPMSLRRTRKPPGHRRWVCHTDLRSHPTSVHHQIRAKIPSRKLSHGRVPVDTSGLARPSSGNDRTAYIVGLFVLDAYVNDLIKMNIGERAKYLFPQTPGIGSAFIQVRHLMIYSGHATMK